MKKFIGLFILVIVIAMVSGCTQPAKTADVTTPEATAVPTVPPTVATPEPTIMPTTVATPQGTTVPATKVTTVVPTTAATSQNTTTNATVVKTPLPVQTASTKITTIYIRNNSFVPQVLTVLPGTGLTWINDDVTVHAIKTTGDHKGMFSSGDFPNGAQWGYTFGVNEDTYEIIDTYSNATCTIIVKKGELLSSRTTVRPTTTA